MAGHSHAKNIMHRKGAKDKIKSKLFTKAAGAISIAAQGGSDPQTNPRLKLAIKQAQYLGVPKDVIIRAIEKTNEKKDYIEMLYEGFTAEQIGVLIEIATDNKNKTAPEIRAIFSKHGGSLGGPNCAKFMFDYVGIIECKTEDFDTFLISAAEAGATDVSENVAIFEPTKLFNAQSKLETQFEITNAELSYLPKHYIKCQDLANFHKFIEELEKNEHVQNYWHNLED